MKLSWLVKIAPLATRVAAGGFHGCLERVALWQTYELEGKSNIGAGDRKIGYHCPQYDRILGCPEGGWEQCGGKGARCSFSALMKQLDPGAPDKGAWLKEISPGRIDVRGTATNCYESYKKVGDIPDFAPHRVLKYSTRKFDDYLVKLGEQTDAMYNSLTSAQKIGQKSEYQALSDNYKTILNIRRGDIGANLIPAAIAELEPEIRVVKEDLGKHPRFGHDMATVDWLETKAEAKAKGVPDYEERIDHAENTYFEGEEASGHQNIVEKYEEVERNRLQCGRK
ncbi:hypothetical protein NQ176_g3561 [Zarea fungicola]|uniref:Uncharacterized protein n=1 Tax=Zarea fungicola TaxID=93591 RepID=A0ACC1NIL7_9HYPO|nr:hypothetical protein NQ176_g3561 [Lecanicillium fungicola]